MGATRHRTSLTRTGRPGLRHPSRKAAPWPRPASWIAAEPTARWLAYAEAWPSTSTWTQRWSGSVRRAGGSGRCLPGDVDHRPQQPVGCGV